MVKFCGIEIINNDTGKRYHPIYPFADLENEAVLQEFIDLYEQELLEFYRNGWNCDFSRFCIVRDYQNTMYGVNRDLDLSLADNFRKRWFRKGVIFY